MPVVLNLQLQPGHVLPGAGPLKLRLRGPDGHLYGDGLGRVGAAGAQPGLPPLHLDPVAGAEGHDVAVVAVGALHAVAAGVGAVGAVPHVLSKVGLVVEAAEAYVVERSLNELRKLICPKDANAGEERVMKYERDR